MLKYRIILLIVLIGCVAIVACDRTQSTLKKVMDDPQEQATGMHMIMDLKADPTTEIVDLPAPTPTMTVEETKAAMNAAGIGQTHGTGVWTVYFNAAAAMENKSDTDKMYPVGSFILKEVWS